MCREMNSTTILANWFDELWCRLESLREVYEFTPKLNIVRVGDRSDTSLYVNSKKKKGKQLQTKRKKSLKTAPTSGYSHL